MDQLSTEVHGKDQHSSGHWHTARARSFYLYETGSDETEFSKRKITHIGVSSNHAKYLQQKNIFLRFLLFVQALTVDTTMTESSQHMVKYGS